MDHFLECWVLEGINWLAVRIRITVFEVQYNIPGRWPPAIQWKLLERARLYKEEQPLSFHVLSDEGRGVFAVRSLFSQP